MDEEKIDLKIVDQKDLEDENADVIYIDVSSQPQLNNSEEDSDNLVISVPSGTYLKIDLVLRVHF